MIIDLFIGVILSFIFAIFSFLPTVTIASLPIIGSAVSSTLILMIKYWNSFIETFPYAKLPWQIFLYVILPFEILMIIAKFFLGSRVPTND